LWDSNPIDWDPVVTEKVNFYPVSSQYFPGIEHQKSSFVNIRGLQLENLPEKWMPVAFVKQTLNFYVTPNELLKNVATKSVIINRNTKSHFVADEMEASDRESSSNRIKLATLGIDYSVEALLSASRQGNLQALKLLLAGGIPPDIKDAVHGVSPLLEGARNGQLQVVQTLLAKGANVNIRNNEGQTALISAVKNNKKEVVKVLLKKGADQTVFDRTGRSAFSYALQTKNSKMISLLARN
jgi:ankyrin repeat protein